ncbi:uncharacterized protein CcaverHIS019_0404310 [Cutaneotrichosporon cavernicola]|uniref:Uncharacterized protein n=1 Tax=Cutaneotrichosporon cavernicola TaxID=279322 RepID=A0AA48L437_9TREE|nr:uncharacterized protein CcaverHIS019_0404310 [Cutaneotrichosporon cavernicola]BEI91611.1 hypothetical protein CcaverHIS019_0404310 [Cutaneotrichosporon cavernicola]BEI99388.1 hypothetical protein CcaverHIS631_0404310 [Cutaneotrichosporon cavernicola]BEJ07164.1 hypothetical protein CcaverHIS641_0404330 [Cutaneotrichosporon cavernicola]
MVSNDADVPEWLSDVLVVAKSLEGLVQCLLAVAHGPQTGVKPVWLHSKIFSRHAPEQVDKICGRDGKC